MLSNSLESSLIYYCTGVLILQGNVIDIGIDIVDVLRIQDKVLKNIF